mmetsp:Transcript_34697/g.121005  ORF Transcript_34697/g.121005 Transcript_34697/m.121005 type:complete len:273 (+) Transcript_34697:1745-2563(+)
MLARSCGLNPSIWWTAFAATASKKFGPPNTAGAWPALTLVRPQHAFESSRALQASLDTLAVACTTRLLKTGTASMGTPWLKAPRRWSAVARLTKLKFAPSSPNKARMSAAFVDATSCLLRATHLVTTARRCTSSCRAAPPALSACTSTTSLRPFSMTPSICVRAASASKRAVAPSVATMVTKANALGCDVTRSVGMRTDRTSQSGEKMLRTSSIVVPRGRLATKISAALGPSGVYRRTDRTAGARCQTDRIDAGVDRPPRYAVGTGASLVEE